VKLVRGRGEAKRKKTRFHDENTAHVDLSQKDEESHFRESVFYVVMDNVIGGLTIRFNAAKNIADKFSCLWKYLTIPSDEVEEKSKSLVDQYPDDITDDLIMEMRHLPTVHRANFRR